MKRLRLIVWTTLLSLTGWSFAVEPGWLQALSRWYR